MRELISDLFVTLDGYAYGEGAPAYFGYLGPDLERWIDDNLARPQVLLMGRRTYEIMWTIVRDQPVEGADRMNELPKVVFSGTLEKPYEWNNSRLVKGDLVDEVRSLKAEDGDPLRTIGSLSVVKALLRAGLVDRLRLVVFPQILGETGREWIFSDLPDIDLQLLDGEEQVAVGDERVVGHACDATPLGCARGARPHAAENSWASMPRATFVRANWFASAAHAGSSTSAGAPSASSSRAESSSVTVGGVCDIASAYSMTSLYSSVKASDSRHRGTSRALVTSSPSLCAWKHPRSRQNEQSIRDATAMWA
jgi:dihydrofolate reductase